MSLVKGPRSAYEWVMPHIRASDIPHMKECRHTYEWVMSHMEMSHVPHMNDKVLNVTLTNESCHTYAGRTFQIRMSHALAWVMSHVWRSVVTNMYESCHTYEWVISMRATCMNDSRHTYEGLTSLIQNECCMHMDSHVTHINESCHTYETIMSYMWTLRVVPCMQICDHMHESCSVLHYVAVCCSVLQCVAMRCSEWLISHTAYRVLHTWCVAECCRCAPVCCSEQVISNKNSNRTNHVDHADCLFVDQIMAICVNSLQHTATHVQHNNSYRTNYADCLFAVQIRTSHREVGGWGRDPKKCTGRGWGMGSSTI